MIPMRYVGTELDVFANATNWKNYVRDTLRPYIRGAVLEVGAGKGSFTRALSGIECTGWLCLEPDPKLADEIRLATCANELPSHVSVAVGSEADLPHNRVFDTVLYLDVLEHISKDAPELKHAARRLSVGGRLIVLSPAFSMLYSPFDAAIGHYRRYTLKSLDHIRPPDVDREAGFYLDAPGALLSLTNRFVLRSAEPSLNQIIFWDRFVVPLARVFDPVVGRRFGRSVIMIWRKSNS